MFRPNNLGQAQHRDHEMSKKSSNDPHRLTYRSHLRDCESQPVPAGKDQAQQSESTLSRVRDSQHCFSNDINRYYSSLEANDELHILSF
jgi:hypothetical protein